jgi:hypothetical protein
VLLLDERVSRAATFFERPRANVQFVVNMYERERENSDSESERPILAAIRIAS